MRSVAKIAVSAAAVLLLAGCGQAATTNSSSTTAPTSASGPSLSVELSEYAITPASVSLAVGQAATITVRNTGSITHTYVVPELGINLTVAPGATQTADVTPTKAGTFAVTCTVAGHKDLGMEGTVVVQ